MKNRKLRSVGCMTLLLLMTITGLAGCSGSSGASADRSDIMTVSNTEGTQEDLEKYRKKKLSSETEETSAAEEDSDTVTFSKKKSSDESASEEASGSGTEVSALGEMAGAKTDTRDLVTYSSGKADTKDPYETSPVPKGEPNPVNPGEVPLDTSSIGTCTLYIECSTLLGQDSGDTIPEDGILFRRQTVTFYQGESVEDVLERVLSEHRISVEETFVEQYNSSYVDSIDGISALDGGAYSRWLYCVNGWYPTYGASRYLVKEGDAIEFHYTCSSGTDLEGAGTGNW